MFKKKISALIACAVIMSAISGCTAKKVEQAPAGGTEPAKQAAPSVVSTLLPSNPTWPFNRDWFIFKELEAATNVKFEISSVTESGFNEKLNLALASGDLPDILRVNLATANKFGAEGAFIDIKQHMSKMPNLSAWIKKYPAQYEESIAPDGKMYLLPYEGMGEANRRLWFYREDTFKKHNLAVPTNTKELYEVLVKLKKEYPNSYPLAMRNGIYQFFLTANQWGTAMDYYYDYDKKEWRYGQIENNFKEMVAFYKKLYDEKLIPQDFLSLDTNQWGNLFSNNQAFISADYVSRIDFFNVPMKKTNPEFNMAFMAPPAGSVPGGAQKMPYTSELPGSIAVSSKAKDLNGVLRFIDFLYSEKGRELVSWGKEGVTYKMENGQKKFIDVNTGADVRNKYGLSTTGTYIWYDFTAELSIYTPQAKDAVQKGMKFDDKKQPKPSFTAEENDILNNQGGSVKKAMESNIASFITGTRSMSEWDKYVSEIKALGLDKVLGVYKTAYERTLKNK
jgi:putative aldouronate transport system substrate-binding protein